MILLECSTAPAGDRCPVGVENTRPGIPLGVVVLHILQWLHNATPETLC